MGRNYKDYEDDADDRHKKNSKGAKHSRNVPGRGMRVINSWYEDEDVDYFDETVGVDDEIGIVLNQKTQR